MANDPQTQSGAAPEKPQDPPKPQKGDAPDVTDPVQRRVAIDFAYDYRGDVTVTTHDGRQLEGFVFDRRPDDDRPTLRIMASSDGARHTLAYDELASLVFSGRDTAAGKSWERWVQQYREKKAAGEQANLYPDSGE